MPRRPTSDEATRAARFFLESFIVKTDSQDHILPKNDTFSPFSGFCRVFPQFAKKKDGGSATDGVSRAAFNKICLEYFEEGMRKPARNGNPGALEANLAQQRRHFLRGRWRDPAYPEDLAALTQLWSSMVPEQVAASAALLEDFSRWKPGPAGRGGERQSRKRGGSDGEGDSDEEAGEYEMRREGGGAVSVSGFPRKRVCGAWAGGGSAPGGGGGGAGLPGALELLCQVASHASSVEEGMGGREEEEGAQKEEEEGREESELSANATPKEEEEAEDQGGATSSKVQCKAQLREHESVSVSVSVKAVGEEREGAAPAGAERVIPKPFASLYQ